MKEHYVSYEQSQALKRLGFDKKVSAVWHFDGEEWNLIPDYGATFQHPKDIPHWNTSKAWGEFIYSAPRLDQAQAWLREVKNVIVCPFPERYKEYVVQGIYSERLSGWDYEIWVDEEEYSEPKFGYIESYEKALEIGIDKALELLGKEVNNA